MLSEGRARLRELLHIFCAGHLFFVVYWVYFKLGDFYFFQGDDVGRLVRAQAWSRHPSFMPYAGWLPLPCYLTGTLLKAFHDPYVAPLIWGGIMTTAVLLLLGLIAGELFPDEPETMLAAPLLALAVPFFEKAGLSAGSEIVMWLFVLANLYAWLLFRRTGLQRWFWLSCAALICASMTRYEAWLYNAAFLAVTAREARVTALRRWSYCAASLSCVVVFAIYVERHMPPSPSAIASLPLSYAGVRLLWNFSSGFPEGVVDRSFAAPIRAFWAMGPLGAACGLLGAAGCIVAFFRKGLPARYAAFAFLCFAALCAEAAIFGFSGSIPQRLVVIFPLLTAPLSARLILSPAPPRRRAAVVLALALLCAAWMSSIMPRDRMSERHELRSPYVAARATRAAEMEGGFAAAYSLGPLPEGENSPLGFAALDRRVSWETLSPEISGPVWITATDRAGARRIGAWADPVAEIGTVAIFARGIPASGIAACRRQAARWFSSYPAAGAEAMPERRGEDGLPSE
ncbi:MAG: hypothetical protein ACHQ2Z_00705 [Elusimicrobiota bacterium]